MINEGVLQGRSPWPGLEVVAIVQWLSGIQLFTAPWTAAYQASLSSTVSWSLLRFMYIELVMLSNHLIPCTLLLLLPSVFSSIRVFSSEWKSSSMPLAGIQSHGLTTRKAGNIFLPCASGRKGSSLSNSKQAPVTTPP